MANNESTQRLGRGPSSDVIGLHIGQSNLDAESKQALMLMSEALQRIDRRTAAMETRLKEQEAWTRSQKTIITRVGWLIGMAVLGGVGTALTWAYDASRGLRP